ncbi:MAG: hypothetical protein AAFP70_10005 [Calditrichota bacterium]
MDLQNIVKNLADVQPNGRPFVSLYLNLETDAVSRKESERFLTERYQRLIKSDAQSLPIGKEANMIWRHIENYLAEDLNEGTRGVAIFARFQAEGDLSFHAHEFAMPFENKLVIDSVPHIFPLVYLLDVSYHYLVLISDSEKAKVFEIRFGQIEDVELISDAETEKSFRGEWTQLHYQNWKNDKVKRFVKSKIDIVEKLMIERDIKHLIMAGDERIVSEIKSQLSHSLKEKVVDFSKMHIRANPELVLHKTLEEFARYERAAESDVVENLQYEVARDGLGVVGSEKVLEALNEGKVDTLLVSLDFEAPGGWRCETCGHLTMAILRNDCIKCGSKEVTHVDLKDDLVRRATQIGATIETVTDNLWLDKHEGIGALLRFR